MEVINKLACLPVLATLMSRPRLSLPSNRTVLQGISAQQRKNHIYTLDSVLQRLAIRYATTSTPSCHLGLEMVKAIEELQKERDWGSPSTVLTCASNLMGAMRRLNQYAEMDSVLLNAESHWKDAMLTWTKEVTKHIANKAPAVRLSHILSIINKDKVSLAAKAFLLVAWLHAARADNVMNLELSKVYLDKASGLFQILWDDAKTCPKIGPYSTPSAITPDLADTLLEWVSGRNQSSETHLFPKCIKAKTAILNEVRTELKLQDPSFNLRSLRRGALITLAEAGVDLETILLFSGHTTVKMLLRYINQGLSSSKRSKQGADAARKALLPGRK